MSAPVSPSATGSVIVVGSINVDLVAVGERVPEVGETVLMTTSYAEHFGGKGGNQAAAAAALGADVVMIGTVGRDAWGDKAVADLASRGIHTGTIARADDATGIAMIQVDAHAQNSIAVVPGANFAVSPDQVRAALATIPDGDHVVLASLEIPLDAVMAAADVAAARGWSFILNPAPAQPLPKSLLAKTSVLTPNAFEILGLGHKPKRAFSGLFKAGLGALVLTLGSDGAQLMRAKDHAHHFDAATADVVDTTGAGDAFSAALAVAIARGQSLEDAVQFAIAVGALATEAAGARGSLPTTQEAHERMASQEASTPVAWSDGTWLNKPDVTSYVGHRLLVTAEQGSDLWRTTYYGFERDSGHALLYDFPDESACEVTFQVDYDQQFDQAGILIRANEKHWVKAGVEVSDGLPQLGAVATDGDSDWSCAPVPHWLGESVTIRASRQRDALIIRARQGSRPWQLVRVVPFATADSVQAGLYCAAPERSGLQVTFEHVEFGPADASLH